MPGEDNNFGGYLVLDFRKRWRYVQLKNTRQPFSNFRRELWEWICYVLLGNIM